MVFDPQKMADLVAEESRVAKELSAISLALNEQHADMKEHPSDDVKNAAYMVGQQKHGQLTRELGTVRAGRDAYGLREPKVALQKADAPLARWLRNGPDGLESSEREMYLGEIKDGGIPGGGGQTFVVKGAVASDATSGQEAVQEEIPPRIIDKLAFYGGVSQVAQQFMTGTGGEYRVMQEDAASQEGEILGAQNTAVAKLDIANIGVVSFGAKTASSKAIVLTREMTQDSQIDIEGYCNRQALRRLGRIWNKAFTLTQSGSGLPIGVVTSASAGITTAVNTGFTWVELMNLTYAVNRAYRIGGEMGEGGFNAEMGGVTGFMISDSAEKVAFTLLDTQNRPIWVPSTREGAPSTIGPYPYVVNNNMDAVASAKIPVIFGNFSYYGIRTVSTVELFRFMDSRTMQNNAVEILAFSRRDGRPMGALTSAACDAVVKMTIKT